VGPKEAEVKKRNGKFSLSGGMVHQRPSIKVGAKARKKIKNPGTSASKQKRGRGSPATKKISPGELRNSGSVGGAETKKGIKKGPSYFVKKRKVFY